MKHVLIAIAAVVLCTATLTAAADYTVYRASTKTPYDFERTGPDEWENHGGAMGTFAALMLVESSAGSVNRIAAVEFWTQPEGRFYTVGTIDEGLSYHDFGNGTGALIVIQDLSWRKVDGAAVNLAALIGKTKAGLPKSLKGTSLIVAPEGEVSRSETSLKLDSKLTPAAAAAADANPGDPFGAATALLVDVVEAMGYNPEP